MATAGGIILIVGKAAIWLLIPLIFGIWELRRHRKMMAKEREESPSLPGWLRAPNAAAVAEKTAALPVHDGGGQPASPAPAPDATPSAPDAAEPKQKVTEAA